MNLTIFVTETVDGEWTGLSADEVAPGLNLHSALPTITGTDHDLYLGKGSTSHSVYMGASELQLGAVDTEAAEALKLGGVNAPDMRIGKVGLPTTMYGPIVTDSPWLRETTGTLIVGGGGNTTKLEIGVSGEATTILGNLTVLGTTLSIESATTSFDDNLLLLNKEPGAAGYSSGLMHRRNVTDATSELPTEEGTSQSQTAVSITDPGPLNLIKLSGAASSTDDAYNGWVVRINHPGKSMHGQERLITDYDGATKVATLASNWTEVDTGPADAFQFPTYTQLWYYNATDAAKMAIGMMVRRFNYNQGRQEYTVIVSYFSSEQWNVSPRWNGSTGGEHAYAIAPGGLDYELYGEFYMSTIYDEDVDEFVFAASATDPGAGGVSTTSGLGLKTDYILFPEQVTPAQAANKGLLYTKEVSGDSELFYLPSSGSEIQITDVGYFNGGVISAFALQGMYDNGAYITMDSGPIEITRELAATAGGSLHMSPTGPGTTTAHQLEVSFPAAALSATPQAIKVDYLGATVNSGSDYHAVRAAGRSGGAGSVGIGVSGFDVGIVCDSHVRVSGSGALTMGAGAHSVTGGSLSITSPLDLDGSSAADKHSFTTSLSSTYPIQIDAGLGGIDMDAGTSGIAVNTSGNIRVENIEANIDAIVLDASHADGALSMASGTGGIDVDSTSILSLEGGEGVTINGAFDSASDLAVEFVGSNTLGNANMDLGDEKADEVVLNPKEAIISSDTYRIILGDPIEDAVTPQVSLWWGTATPGSGASALSSLWIDETTGLLKMQTASDTWTAVGEQMP